MSVKQASEDYQKSLDDLIRVYRDWHETRRSTIQKLKEIVKIWTATNLETMLQTSLEAALELQVGPWC